MHSTFHKLRKILHEKFSFHYDQVQLETQLELELGMDSREMFEFLNEIETAFQIQIDLDEVDHLFETHPVVQIQDIVNYIQEKMGLESFSNFDKT
jgi:acyl carrier protein